MFLSLVARRAIDGVLEATQEIGGNVEEVATAAVGGAIEAAGSIGNTAVMAVKDMLVGAIKGIKEVAGAALPKPESGKVMPATEALPSKAHESKAAEKQGRGKQK
jgi:hypothetical protein